MVKRTSPHPFLTMREYDEFESYLTGQNGEVKVLAEVIASLIKEMGNSRINIDNYFYIPYDRNSGLDYRKIVSIARTKHTELKARGYFILINFNIYEFVNKVWAHGLFGRNSANEIIEAALSIDTSPFNNVLISNVSTPGNTKNLIDCRGNVGAYTGTTEVVQGPTNTYGRVVKTEIVDGSEEDSIESIIKFFTSKSKLRN